MRYKLCLWILGAWFILFGSTASARAATSGDRPPLFTSPSSSANSSGNLVQFKAGEHIIGLQSHKVYIAGMDHALTIEFLDSTDHLPQSSGAGNQTGAVPSFGTATYANLWDGITLTYTAADSGIIKSTFTLDPGADVARIQLRYSLPVELAGDGSLVFQVASQRGRLTESAPIAWQEIGGEHVPVPVQFLVLPAGHVGFQVGAYDPTVILTIDPVYDWHTFYGALGEDQGTAIALDASGNIYMTGDAKTTWQSDSNADPKHAYNAGGDIFVLKLDANGSYQWHTFYGASSADYSKGIAVDSSGNVYVTGIADMSWQGDGNTGPKHAFTGGTSPFVLKLDTNGIYQWHTFYGSSWDDTSGGIAVDASGVYVAGTSQATWQGDGNTSPKHAHAGSDDLLVFKLDLNGNYLWHTFYGSGSGDSAYALAVDASGYLYVTGTAASTFQGDGNTSPKHTMTAGMGDIVVLKLSTDGLYQWHTFYGGQNADVGNGIAVETGGTVYVSGTSYQNWQGDGNTNPKHAFGGTKDIFVLKLSTAGVYQWHTFYGSTNDDYGTGISVDSSGNVYVTGTSDATWQGDGNVNPKHAHSGNMEIAILKLDTAGVYQWHTFYGSCQFEDWPRIAVDGTGTVRVVGTAYATWQGDGNSNPLHAYNGQSRLFALRLGTTGAYAWHTFWGAGIDETGEGIAMDASGNVYVLGKANATWQGGGITDPKHPYNGGADLVVIKLSPSGVYQWHTFYGGPGADLGHGIASDTSGGIYVTGTSATTWQGDGNTNPKHAHSGGAKDVFVLKLDTSGVYQWHTFYGNATALGEANGIAAGSGAVYVTGSSTFPGWQGDGDTNPKHGYVGFKNIFVLKLNTSGVYQWHTFYGSPFGEHVGNAIAVDASGSALVTGRSYDGWTADGTAAKHPFGNLQNLFVLKLNPNGVYQWHTFYGDNSGGLGITTDSGGSSYVTGFSPASWQGDNNTNPLHAHSNTGNSVVVLKLDPSGIYQWHTFYGATSQGNGIVLSSGHLYIAGTSSNTWQGDGNANPDHAYSGAGDLMVLVLSQTGGYRWHTFFGATLEDSTGGLAVTPNGSVYVAGSSNPGWLGPGSAVPLNAYTDGRDILVLKLSIPIPRLYLPYTAK